MGRKKRFKIFLEILAAGILIFLLVFVLGFKVTKVEVEGNGYYTDEQIKNMILDAPIAQNSILATFIRTEEKTRNADLIERVTIRNKDRNTIVLQVKEKQMIGYLEFQGQCVHFDRQGMIQMILDYPLEDVPLIEGLDVNEAKQGERLKGVNTTKLNTILSVGKMLEKTENKPDRLVFNDMSQLILYYGDIEARLGDDENMDEKMNRLSGILPQLTEMAGILHLENISEDTQSVVFDQQIASAEDQENTEDDQEQSTDEQETQITEEDDNDLEYSSGREAAENG